MLGDYPMEYNRKGKRGDSAISCRVCSLTCGRWHTTQWSGEIECGVRGGERGGVSERVTKEPQYLAENLLSRGEIVCRNTRQNDQLHFNKVRLEIGRKVFPHLGPKLFNSLAFNLKLLKGFQLKLK
ncbi:hypothetical protein J6590_064665 [Homalodisca vitripennis]|nr:hypothetical protein J6590_064665 [Homalodisca vitripennis]